MSNIRVYKKEVVTKKGKHVALWASLRGRLLSSRLRHSRSIRRSRRNARRHFFSAPLARAAWGCEEGAGGNRARRAGKMEAPSEQVSGLGKSLFLAKSSFAALGALAVAIVGGYFYFRGQQRNVPFFQPSTRETMVEEQVVSDEDVLSYWVIEGDVDVDTSGRRAT